jgi:hypothetical protein
MGHKFIIYAPSYSDKNGGSMVLHQLCNLLRQAGESAYIWPLTVPYVRGEGVLRSIYKCLLLLIRLFLGKRFKYCSSLDTPQASLDDLDGAIVIYPEIVDGNPLCAEYVVRWLLHKPGFHTGKANFGSEDLFFCFQDAFNSLNLNPSENKLTIIVGLYDVYKQLNFGSRSGVCYVLRKGVGRAKNHDLSDGVVIDNLSHLKIASIFNECEYCISYDMHTMYSIYASLCGCKSIIVPEPGVSKEEWQPNLVMRFGLAYGKDDLDWALDTRLGMLENIKKIENENVHSVQCFSAKCKTYFSGRSYP